jgi:hypothetical protein
MIMDGSCYPIGYFSGNEVYSIHVENDFKSECSCCGELFNEDKLSENGYCESCLEEMEMGVI